MADRIELGYWLSTEEQAARRLVDLAQMAEEAGFDSAMISDHYHPWIPEQGHAPFVWAVIGAIAERTRRLHLTTGVTAPILRMHPAVVAQAAATAAVLLPDRFALGVGTGERLSEHVIGGAWPRPGVRRRMLEEAIGIIQALWSGEKVNHEGTYFEVRHAQLYTRPVVPPPIYVAAGGRRSAQLAARIADGIIAVEPQAATIQAFESAGGQGKPRFGELNVCVADSEAEARRIAHRWWPNGAMPPPLLTELEDPQQFAKAATLVSEERIAAQVLCSADPDRHVAAIGRWAAAGFTRLYVHQVGPDQEALFDLYRREVLPRFRTADGGRMGA